MPEYVIRGRAVVEGDTLDDAIDTARFCEVAWEPVVDEPRWRPSPRLIAWATMNTILGTAGIASTFTFN